MISKWWPNYFYSSQSDVFRFWKQYLKEGNRNILYVMGKGFDSRMNKSLRALLRRRNYADYDLTCFLIEFIEEPQSPTHYYKKQVQENYIELISLLGVEYPLIERTIQLVENGHRVEGRRAAELFKSNSFLLNFTDIFVDLSTLPRSIIFPVLKHILRVLTNTNVHVHAIVIEDSYLDTNIVPTELYESAEYMFTFTGQMELESSRIENTPILWFPVLSENRTVQLEKVRSLLLRNLTVPALEICPILPFPAQNPRRVDNIIIEYHIFLVEELGIDANSIMYVDETNPFDVYRRIIEACDYYDDAFTPLGGCRKVISVESSKLLSLGALIAALEKEIAIAYLPSMGYKVNDTYSKEESNPIIYHVML